MLWTFVALSGGGVRAIPAAVTPFTEPTWEELIARVPPGMRPDRPTVPDEQNAALVLVQVLRQAKPPELDVQSAIFTLSRWDLAGPLNSNQVGRVRSWLRENAATLQLFRSAAGRSGCLFPLPSVTNSVEGLRGMMALGNGLVGEACLLWRAGARADAIAELHDALVLSGLQIQGARTLIHHLVARAACRRALDAIRAAAASPEITATELQRLADLLVVSPDDVARFRACIRSELVDFVVPSTRWDALWANYAGTLTNATVRELYPEELHRPLALVFDPKLLARHPQPFEAGQAVQESVDYWTEIDRRVQAPWTPDPLPDTTAATREKFIADFAPVAAVLEREKVPLSNRAVARAAPHFLKLKNPVGRLLASLPVMTEAPHLSVFESLTRWRAVRSVVALRRWAVAHGGVFPESLVALVDAGLLPDLPEDAFAGRPLHYSRERGRVWSVGRNARDDDGKNTLRDAGTADDLVWSIVPGTAP